MADKSDQQADQRDQSGDQRDQKTYDQAYVTRLENEAAKHRQNAAEAQRERDELKTYRAAREQEELEKKGQYEQALAALQAERAAESAKHAEEIAARDRRALVAEAKVLAAKAGIIDPSDVASLDLRDLRMDESGSVPGLAEKIEALKGAKPHWFKGSDSSKRDRAPATPLGNTVDPSVDWAKKSAADVDQYLKSILRA